MGEKVLVTGGAGYIGSHVVKQLGELGYEIVIYDNLSTGSSAAIVDGELVIGDLAEVEQLSRVFAQYQFDAVLHFAASISVPESLQQPLTYYSNNTANTLNLLKCCQQFQVNKLIFSSTAAVYGETDDLPVVESAPTNPVNPYGKSKLMSETIIRDYSNASDLKYVILRYFNVAGADISGRLGQSSKKAAHLIKLACDAALGVRDGVSIFGTDYPTPDGTGVRDYIHIEDLASAHVDALSYLQTASESQILNCGYGKGYSVREVLDTVQKVSGVNFPILETERRKGDPACVVACGDRIRKVLGWQPQYNSLETIVRSTLDWEKKSSNIVRQMNEPAKKPEQIYNCQDLIAKSNWYGKVAQAYNKVRPRYSVELIDFAIDNARLSIGDKILEIGCGPGIATTSFAKRGFELVSLEPNLEACRLAQKNCAVYPSVEICQTTLEEWTLKPKEFDAVLAATSIHWVSSEIGYPKIDRALKDGGSLILLWNAGLQPSEEINELLKPIYEAYAPSLKPFKARKQEKEELQALEQKVLDSGYFKLVAATETIIEVNYSLEDYLLLLSTYSPYIALKNRQRQNLFAAIEEVLRTWGDRIPLSYLSMVQVFERDR